MRSLETLYQDQVISALELSAARTIIRVYKQTHPLVGLGVAFAHAALRLGHLALRLDQLEKDFSHDVLQSFFDQREEEIQEIKPLQLEELPSVHEWREALEGSSAVWVVDGNQPWTRTPLVLDGMLLFTYKAWKGEAQVAHNLLKMTHCPPAPLPNPSLLWKRLFGPIGTLEDPKEGWFEAVDCAESDPQYPRWDRARFALYTALHHSITVIHGGPGTGKTTLTQRILAALYDQYDHPNDPLKIEA